MRVDNESKSRRKYSRISFKKREDLVNMILENHQTIACAARRLGLNASTARMILNKYKKTGSYPMKTFRKPLKGICAQQALQRGKPQTQNIKCESESESISMMEQNREERCQQRAAVSKPFDPWLQYMVLAQYYQGLQFGNNVPLP